MLHYGVRCNRTDAKGSLVNLMWLNMHAPVQNSQDEGNNEGNLETG